LDVARNLAMNSGGMLGNLHLMSWRARISLAAVPLLVGLAGGCSVGGIGAANAPSGEESSPTALGFSAEPSPKSPLPVVHAQADVTCPPVEIREGASTLTVGPSGENTTMTLKYQGSFVRAARDCSVVGSDMVIKVGVQGRIVIGPAGGPGEVKVPVRIAVVQEAPGLQTDHDETRSHPGDGPARPGQRGVQPCRAGNDLPAADAVIRA
jgi:hypothetical protein